jgi:2-polyprenyl-6-methoxyphenol hydroxylase-like FAD-dependent oxidoreductase
VRAKTEHPRRSTVNDRKDSLPTEKYKLTYDVVIAGAGPVGLFLAFELGLAGTSVLVLERMEDPHSPLKEGWMGMRGLNFPSVDAFYRRGMLKDVRESSLAWMEPAKPGFALNSQANTSAPAPRFTGHFAGIMLDANKIDLSRQQYLVQGPSSAGGLASLEGLEEVLAEHALKLGVEVKRGMPVTDFTQSEDSVTVHAGNESFQCKWLIGCDGGRSTVRKLAGFEFEGTDPEFTGYSAWVEIADPEKLRPGFNLTPHGMYVNGPGPGRIGLVDFDNAAFDREQEITLESLQALLRRVSNTDVTIKTLHVATSYTDRARQATTYKKGRVLLAGDAAHIHSPLGGQGLNTGLGDAMNLGWKLAATIKGWAPEDLLDTYTAERHPVGAWALNWTRAQVAIMRPDPHAQAITTVIRDLINTKDGTNYFVEKISGILLRYDLPGDHPLIGRSAPDLEFEDGSRLGQLLRNGTGLLLDLSAREELNRLGKKWNGRLKYVAAQAKDNKGLAALLLRPDGFVAWATDADPNLTALEETIHRWFGSPA